MIDIRNVTKAQDGFAAAGWGVDGVWIGQVDGNGLVTHQVNFETDPNYLHFFNGVDHTFDGGYIAAGPIRGGESDISILRINAGFSTAFCQHLTRADIGSTSIQDSYLNSELVKIKNGGTKPSTAQTWIIGNRYLTICC